MAQLTTNPLKTAFAQLKAAIVTAVGQIPGAGKVNNRIRYANDFKEWLKIAAVERVAGIEVLRAVFIYLQGFTTTRVEGSCKLFSLTYAIEVVQAFEDGTTDEENSTARYEEFLANLCERFAQDLYLGFTDGPPEVTHDELQGAEGDNRPEFVDGVLAHRKTLSITVKFKR